MYDSLISMDTTGPICVAPDPEYRALLELVREQTLRIRELKRGNEALLAALRVQGEELAQLRSTNGGLRTIARKLLGR